MAEILISDVRQLNLMISMSETVIKQLKTRQSFFESQIGDWWDSFNL